jgi:hypothetical protein
VGLGSGGGGGGGGGGARDGGSSSRDGGGGGGGSLRASVFNRAKKLKTFVPSLFYKLFPLCEVNVVNCDVLVGAYKVPIMVAASFVSGRCGWALSPRPRPRPVCPFPPCFVHGDSSPPLPAA